MPEEQLPDNLIPPPVEEVPIIEEIVSPVQPPRPVGLRAWHSVFTVLILLVAAAGLGYLVYGNWPTFGSSIKVAKAPETPGTTITTVSPTPLPTGDGPASTSAAAEPRISSTSTDTPSTSTASTDAAASPRVAAASTAAATAFTYTDASGFSVKLPAGAQVQAKQESGRVVEVYAKNGSLLGVVGVSEFLLEHPGDLASQLRLGDGISNVQFTASTQGYSAYRYTTPQGPAMAIIRANKVYYITDYSGQLLSGFAVE